MDLTSPVSGGAAFLLLVLGFGFIIFVHELGHFLVAKAVGIKVTQFAIGFGHALVSWRKGLGLRVGSSETEFRQRLVEHVRRHATDSAEVKEKTGAITEEQAARAAAELGLGETEYRWNWMPLGGYVKMLGQEDLDPTAVSVDPRAYNNKPIWARVCVVSAGVIMNGIFAVVFFLAAFSWGVEFPPAVVGAVVPGSPAATTAAVDHPEIVGLEPGDVAVLINGDAPSDFMSIQAASALAKRGKSVDMVIDRPIKPGEFQRLRFVMEPKASEQQEGLRMLGVAPTLSLEAPKKLDERYSEYAGKRITAVNGEGVSEWWQLYRAIQAAEGKPLMLTLTDGKATSTTEVATMTGLQMGEAALGSERQRVLHLLGLVPATRIEGVRPGSPAKGLLKAGDVIASVGETAWPTIAEFTQHIANSRGAMEMTVLRDGRREKVIATPVRPWRPWHVPALLNVDVSLALDTPVIARVLPESPFAALAWRPGTRITHAAGRPINSFGDLRHAIEAAGAGEMSVTAMLPSEQPLEETAAAHVPAEAVAALSKLGWDAELPPLPRLDVLQKADGAGEALALGFKKTQLFMVQTYQTLAALFEGTVAVKNMRGPIGIIDAGTDFTQRGVPYLMFFLGLISINLAVINFLPLPIVDGGLFVLLMIEKLRGKPVSPQIQSVITVAGLVLLGTIFLTVTFHDITRWFTGG